MNVDRLAKELSDDFVPDIDLSVNDLLQAIHGVRTITNKPPDLKVDPLYHEKIRNFSVDSLLSGIYAYNGADSVMCYIILYRIRLLLGRKIYLIGKRQYGTLYKLDRNPTRSFEKLKSLRSGPRAESREHIAHPFITEEAAEQRETHARILCSVIFEQSVGKRE
ncbi:hypothetical protein KQX54_006255 [Cotesia glomerata]|uniref:Uncharacterized protein n=1 Tax=Cotesia glomerata TaxID=32391 RepID=A0AAV7IXV4_COTGL|nr:hypothetical protein KQX54_006255 [Cotesia glomerata]